MNETRERERSMNRRLFADDPKPRAKPRVLMHVIDAGAHDAAVDWVLMKCGKCEHESGWVVMNRREAKRGVPCPQCNKLESE